MLKKTQRVRKEGEFKQIYTQSSALHSPLLILRFKKKKAKSPKIGFVVGNKISKKATQRNKIKRQLRAITKENYDIIKPYYDYLVITKPVIVGRQYQEIATSLQVLLKKVRTRQ